MVEKIRKIIIPLWSTNGRDFQIIMPIVYFLEKIKGYEVTIISVWDWFIVDRLKPDLVLFANTIGGNANVKFLKYLKSKGYKVVSLVSEGNFMEKDIEIFVWGLNKEKILHEDMTFFWSYRCLNMTLKYYPELKTKIKVCGAIGFDRYEIYSFMKKKDFLVKYDKSKYRKVIGYACWVFDLIRTDKEIENINNKILLKEIGEYRSNVWKENYENYISMKFKINETLKNSIKNNPDILFILKLHPGTLDNSNTEIKGLNADNVLTLKYEEEISDIINVCDIWTAFDSTTAIEAWLLNKPTINLFPPDFEDDRALNFNGSICVYNYEDFQKYIDEYYVDGSIKDFESLDSHRKNVIEQVIQWDDGLNHVRVGREITKIIEQSNQSRILKDTIKTRFKLYGIHLLIKYSKYLKKLSVFNNKHYIFYQASKDEILEYKEKYYPYFHKFYDDNYNVIHEQLQDTGQI